MRVCRRLSALFVAAPVLLALCAPALVGHAQLLSTEGAFLSGFEENLPVVSPGSGFFAADINADVINYQLLYVGIPTAVTQAHIHLGNPGTNGPIIVFLCSNLGDIPPGVQALPCPAAGELVVGTIVATDVLQAADGDRILLSAGDLEGLKQLFFAGAVYANVHSEQHPPGEIRGQVNPRER